MFRLKRRVLLIDDQPLVREGLRLLIEREADLEVCGELENGRLVVQAMVDLGPDIAIIDPSSDGKMRVDTIREIVRGPSNVLVLVLSFHKEILLVEHALRAGAKGYVLKQEAISNVINAIRHVLNGKIYISESLSGPLLERLIDGLPGGRNPGGVESFSDREFLVFEMIGEGMTTKQIAEKLYISTKTVETYRGRLKRKIGLKDHIDLRKYAITWSKHFSDNHVSS